MRIERWGRAARIGFLAATLLGGAPESRADVITDSNGRAAAVASRLQPTPPAVRVMALVQVSVFDAVNSITGRYPAIVSKVSAPPGAAVEAAVAAATRTALLGLVAAEKESIETDYQAALGQVPEGPAKLAGIAVGEQAAAAVLAARADDGATAPEKYRPHATPGRYVPTVLPILPEWGRRKPWVLSRGEQFHPGPPPDLAGEIWVRDFNEVKALGAKNGSRRTAEQTAIARFWEATGPLIYWPVAQSVAAVPGRDASDNARLLALAGMAMDDAMIAIFEAKYAYNFWRPITAIRNGDLDGSDATERDPGWTPLIDTPLHPEYPCAHCVLSGALGAVLEAEIGSGPAPKLSSRSPSAGGAVRTWATVADFTREVAEARICDGVHYRNSTEVGTAMGKQIGALAAAKTPRSAK